MMFSIIIPIYKVEKYLEKCVDSVLVQTYKDYELILVDDGSPDKCGLICDNYAKNDKRIKVIHKINGGLSEARNAGLNIAQGEFILFIDSDDYWAVDTFLDELALLLSKRPSDIVVFTGKVEYPNGKLVQLRGEHNLDLIRSSNKKEVIYYLQQNKKFPGASWIICTKHSLIKKLNLRFIKGVIAEDYIWITTLMYYADTIDAMNTTVYRYVKRAGSLSGNFNIKSFEGLTNSIINWMKLDKRKEYPCLFIYHQRVFLLALRCWGRMSSKDRELGRERMKESSHILEFPNQKSVLILYKLLGPYLLGNIIYYGHRLVLKLRGVNK